MLIFAPSKIIERLGMSLTQAAYFYALKDINPTATAWVSGNTPKASLDEPDSA